MSVERMLSDYGNIVESELKSVLSHDECSYNSVIKAMEYSTLLGGKRIRPALLLEFHKISGGNINDALPFACALEMIHTYSLIHDDLPCMDNDDMRRGKPSCHVAFGEDIALLAGDGLLTESFSTCLKTSNISADLVIKCAAILSNFAGVDGMIGGQVIDLESENKSVDLDTLKQMYSLKTGALLKAAASIGCILAGADKLRTEAALNYAESVGFAFQIVDDILDKTSDVATLGKPIGSDDENQKSTFVSLVGMESAVATVDDLTKKAKESLLAFDMDTRDLADLADYLSNRKY